jgi:hypothetical protein
MSLHALASFWLHDRRGGQAHPHAERNGQRCNLFAPKRTSLNETYIFACIARKQLSVFFRVSVDGTQLGRPKDREMEQADMSLSKLRFLRWLLKNAASQRGIAGKEDVMAKLIEFYVPANFQSPKKKWTPEELRGKIIDFHATNTRKSA